MLTFSLLILLVLQITTALGLTCPAISHDVCQCKVKFGTLMYMTCVIQDDGQIPEFHASETVLRSVNIESKQILKELHSDAFKGIDTVELNMPELQMQIIDAGAFSGMGTSLRVINLERNQLTEIDQNMFSDVTQLIQLSMSNNNIYQISEDAFRSLRRLERLSLASNYIGHLEDETFSSLRELTELDLHGNSINQIKEDYFRRLINLRILHLQNNNLRTIEMNSFYFTDELTHLNLANNDLTWLPNSLFRHLSKLVQLNLSGNRLSDMSNLDFTGLTRLQYLDISANLLRNADRLLTDLESIVELNLAENQISSISDNVFIDCHDMTFLNLSYNHIDSFDKYAFKRLSNLDELNMEHNNIKELQSDAFVDLVNLKYLYMSHNDIDEIIPSVFNGLDKLESLYMEHNRLESVRTESGEFIFENLLNLQDLRLGFNQISQIFENGIPLEHLSILKINDNDIDLIEDEAFAGCPNLKTLDLSSNRLRQYSVDTWKNLNRLAVLYLDNNKLDFLPDNGFRYLGEKLVTLKLSQNRIQDINRNSLKKLKALDKLDLGDNRITSIASMAFYDSKDLTSLKLNDNRLSSLNSNSFGNMRDLEHLDLSNNRLTFLKQSDIKDLRVIEEIDFTGNPVHCDCDMAWLRDFEKLSDKSSFICNSPRNFRHQRVECFQSSDCPLEQNQEVYCQQINSEDITTRMSTKVSTVSSTVSSTNPSTMQPPSPLTRLLTRSPIKPSTPSSTTSTTSSLPTAPQPDQESLLLGNLDTDLRIHPVTFSYNPSDYRVFMVQTFLSAGNLRSLSMQAFPGSTFFIQIWRSDKSQYRGSKENLNLIYQSEQISSPSQANGVTVVQKSFPGCLEVEEGDFVGVMSSGRQFPVPYFNEIRRRSSRIRPVLYYAKLTSLPRTGSQSQFTSWKSSWKFLAQASYTRGGRC